MAGGHCLCGRLTFETRGEQKEAFEPQGHAFFEERIRWFDTRDGLPRK